MNKEAVGLHLHTSNEESKATPQEKLSLCLDKWNKVKKKKKKATKEVDELCGSIESLGKNSAVLLPQETDGNKWTPNIDDDDIPMPTDKVKKVKTGSRVAIYDKVIKST